MVMWVFLGALVSGVAFGLIPLVLMLYVAPWVVDNTARARQQNALLLQERAERAEREHERQATLAVRSERARIARELHDPPSNRCQTGVESDIDVVAEAEAGASGFLLKDAPPEELISAIRVVAGGYALLAPSVTRRLIEEFVQRPGPTANDSGRLEQLTEREIKVPREVATGSTNAEIAQTSHLLTKLGTATEFRRSLLRRIGAGAAAQQRPLSFSQSI